MKTVIKYLSIAFFACMTMLACGNVDDPDDPYTPTPTPNPPTPTTQGKFMSMDHDIPAAASEEILTLTGLSSSISEMAGQDYFSSWLTITKEAYTSGAPKIKLIAKENLTTTTRLGYVVFVAAKDTLALTIKQAVYKSGTDVNNPNDTPTDQPAYSREQ